MSLGMIALAAVIVLGVLGAVFGLMLGYASKVFHVEEDPRQAKIVECLPNANCGGCGYPGCAGYASAVVSGEAATNCCAAGGQEVADKVAAIMGVEAKKLTKRTAQVMCTGGGCAHLRYDYTGIADCLQAARMLGGGAAECTFSCYGYGTCASVCPQEAITVRDGAAHVDPAKCIACGKCVDICPRKIITIVPMATKRHVAITCSSKEKGADTRKHCDNGCIGCGICAKTCPKEAITVADNLAKIDYDKCVGCGLCAQKCPRHLITVDGKVPEIKPAAPKAAPAQDAAE